MKHTPARTALACSLTLALGLAAVPPAQAQAAAAVDEDIAATPTDLAELLGPDGLDAAQTDFYLHMQMPGQGSGVMHWATAVVDGQLVFTMDQSMNDGEMTNRERQVFTGEGEFVSSTSSTDSADYKSSESAVREGDKVRVTSSYSFDGEAGEVDEEVHDFDPPEDTIPTSWLPMAFAYHIRAGHEQFVVRMTDDVTGAFSFVQVFRAEDVGTEVVEVGGAEVEAHVLMLTMTAEYEGGEVDPGVVEEQVMQMYVLADGTIVRMRAEFEGMVMSAEAVTAEEAAELMDATGDGAGEGDEAGEDDGVGGLLEDAGDAIRDAAE